MRSMHHKKKPPKHYRVHFRDHGPPVQVDNRGLQVRVTMTPRPGPGCTVRLYDMGDGEWCLLEISFGPHCTAKELKRKIRDARIRPLTSKK